MILDCHFYVEGDRPEFNTNVKTYQKTLSDLGWFIAADGCYGLLSDQITRLFQKQHGLVPDGVLGPKTWAKALETNSRAEHRKLSPQEVSFICGWEGFEPKAYEDAVGVWTIGYGHTKTARPGMRVTKEQAEALMAADLAEAEQAVQGAVSVGLCPWEFAALTSLTFNIGTGGFRSSTLLKKLNKEDRAGAAREFLSWNRGDGRVLPGLTRRRVAEKQLFENKGIDKND